MDNETEQTSLNNVTETDGKYVQGRENTSVKELPNVPTNEQEFSGGNPETAGYGYDVPEVKEVAVGIRDSGPTTQLTDLPLLTTEDREECGPNVTSSIGRARTQKDPIPFAVIKGTNSLIAFGASYSMRAIRRSPVTGFGSAGTQIDPVGTFSGRFRSPASTREVYAYKSFGEMKDAIISYRSRSIAYTNLEQADMFLLEIAREQALASAALPFYASKMARDYVRMLTRRGLKFSPALASNLIDPEVSKSEMILFTDLAGQKTFDPTLYTRMGMFSVLHESSGKVGPLPQLIIQDVVIPDLVGYTIPGVSQSGYKVTIPARGSRSGRSSGNINSNYSLLDWVTLYLGGSITNLELKRALDEASELVNATFNGMKIITGAIDTIEANRGAKFSTIGEFLPITGKHHEKGNCILDYIESESQFSYFFKERFEHAPQFTVGESATGANSAVYSTNLANITTAYQKGSYLDGESTFTRPAGLYKGDNAWATDEIAYMGVFRGVEDTDEEENAAHLMQHLGLLVNIAPPANQNTPIYGANSARSGANNITVSTTNVVTVPSAVRLGGAAYVDAIYGDVYVAGVAAQDSTTVSRSTIVNIIDLSAVMVFAGTAIPTPTCVTSSTTQTFTVSWMPPIGSWYPTITGWFNVTGYNTAALGYAYDFTTGTPANNDNPSALGTAYMRLARAFMNMDLTETPIIAVGSTAGQVDRPVFVPQGYRGAYWYTITLSTVENTIIDAAGLFTLTYKNNAMTRADRAPVNSK